MESQANPALKSRKLYLPTGIVQRDGKSVIFAIDAGHARVRAVTPGQTFSDLRLVEGIGAGTQVVKQPPAEMNDGAKVTLAATATK